MKVPHEKLIRVKITKDGNHCGKEKISIPKKDKDYLYSLKPWNYFQASSNPLNGLKTRAVLKTVELATVSMRQLRLQALDAMHRGDDYQGILKTLTKVVSKTNGFKRFDLRSHLIIRYAKFSISEIMFASQTLHTFGLSPNDMKNPFLKGTLSRPKADA